MLPVILLSMLMILLSKCDQASDLSQLEMASELESDLRDIVDFKVGKTQLVSSDRSNNTGSIDVNKLLEEISFFKMLGLTFSSKLDWGS